PAGERGGRRDRTGAETTCCGVPPRLTLPAHAAPRPLFFVPGQSASRSALRQPPLAEREALRPGSVNGPGRSVEVGAVGSGRMAGLADGLRLFGAASRRG